MSGRQLNVIKDPGAEWNTYGYNQGHNAPGYFDCNTCAAGFTPIGKWGPDAAINTTSEPHQLIKPCFGSSSGVSLACRNDSSPVDSTEGYYLEIFMGSIVLAIVIAFIVVRLISRYRG